MHTLQRQGGSRNDKGKEKTKLVQGFFIYQTEGPASSPEPPVLLCVQEGCEVCFGVFLSPFRFTLRGRAMKDTA